VPQHLCSSLASFSSQIEEFCREGCTQPQRICEEKIIAVQRRIVASQRLISDKVRLVYKPAAAESAEKSHVQASCMVDIFRGTDKPGQRGDESCLTGSFNSDAILKLAAAGLIPGSFETGSIDQPVGISSMFRMTKSSGRTMRVFPVIVVAGTILVCRTHSCSFTSSPQQITVPAVHSENSGLCKAVCIHIFIVS